MRDPYFDVKAEVESSLISAAALHSSYNRILLTLPIESHSTSEELLSTKAELKSTLSNLSYDISELDSVVSVLEQDVQKSSSSAATTQTKFGVSFEEVKKRRAWVTQAHQKLKDMKKLIETSVPTNPPSSSYHPLLPSPESPTSLISPGPLASKHKPKDLASSRIDQHSNKFSGPSSPFRYPQSPRDLENQTEEYFHEQQSIMLKRQDETLGTISGVVHVLREQASLMGQEISEQNVMLDDLDHQIDHTESRLSKANRKLNKFVEQNKNSKSSWTILILIIILTCLLFAIIFI